MNETTIRNRIGDKPKTEIERYIGNGTLTAFDIHNKNPFDFVITIANSLVSSADYEYDSDIEKVIFDTAPANEANMEIKYKYAAFTDLELTQFIADADDDIDKATSEALRQTLGDQARMVSFQHGDRSVSMSDIFKNLSTLLDKYERRITNAGANSGSSFEIGTRTMSDAKQTNGRSTDISRLFE